MHILESFVNIITAIHCINCLPLAGNLMGASKYDLYFIQFEYHKTFLSFHVVCLFPGWWITVFIKLGPLLISGIMNWSATKTLCVSSTNSVTTWQRRPCGSCRSRSSPGTSPGARRNARRRPRGSRAFFETDLQLCFLTLTPLYYRLRERRMEAIRWSKWETHCGGCRTS